MRTVAPVRTTINPEPASVNSTEAAPKKIAFFLHKTDLGSQNLGYPIVHVK
nr:hypothetical protein [uncultured Allomuricauda sp.]